LYISKEPKIGVETKIKINLPYEIIPYMKRKTKLLA